MALLVASGAWTISTYLIVILWIKLRRSSIRGHNAVPVHALFTRYLDSLVLDPISLAL